MHRMTPRLLILLALAAALAVSPAAGQPPAPRPMTFDDFAAVKAVSDPQLSPDGAWLLYAVRTTELEANRRTTDTYVTALRGGPVRPFPDDTSHAAEARWSPDGRRVAYVAGGQLWVADASGGSSRRLTTLTGGATGPVWSPAGDRIAFVSAVYPDCPTEACNAERAKAKRESKVGAHVADQLLYRHWTSWDEGTRSHLFVVGADGSGLRDATQGVTYDVPPGPFGGSEGYAWSSDGKELAYTAKEAGRDAAWTTDVNVYVVPVDGGAPKNVTAANRGADQNPVYAPGGRWIAYASQSRPGFESDRWRLMLLDRQTGQSRELLPRWDRNAEAYAFTPDGRSVLITTGDRGRDKVFRVALGADGSAASAPAALIGERNNTALTVARNGRMLAWLRDAADRPAEVYAAALGSRGVANVRAVTHLNDTLVAGLALNAVEEMWFAGADGDSVHAFVLKPPRWEPGRRYPAVLLIHGGPQGAWLDQWHGRWNYQVLAATGSAVIVVNPRGSTGYGQHFVDEVSRDWGGKAYADLMKGVDAALARYSWIDSTRLGAAGGSYGGYMANWMEGHTDRFKALVSHAGIYNLEAMYGATEEVWFPEWELGGPYWDSTAMAAQYRRYSPHLFARNFKTPMLVLHGELDYRVPYTEGLSLFTALQRQGVPSRLVVFPDEGHWIGKPQNQRLWWREVQGWLDKYLRPGSGPMTD